MPQDDKNVPAFDSQAQITLELLSAIEADDKVTQRALAQRLGVALGLANTYLKRCVRKGLIKVQQAPTNRYSYYMTPKGFSEKSRLTAEFLKQSFNFFRVSRQQLGAIFETIDSRQNVRIALIGKSDLAEVAILNAAESGRTLTVIVDPVAAKTTSSFMQIPVVPALDATLSIDIAIITDMSNPQGAYDITARALAPDSIHFPRFLGIRRDGAPVAPEEVAP